MSKQAHRDSSCVWMCCAADADWCERVWCRYQLYQSLHHSNRQTLHRQSSHSSFSLVLGHTQMLHIAWSVCLCVYVCFLCWPGLWGPNKPRLDESVHCH